MILHFYKFSLLICTFWFCRYFYCNLNLSVIRLTISNKIKYLLSLKFCYRITSEIKWGTHISRSTVDVTFYREFVLFYNYQYGCKTCLQNEFSQNIRNYPIYLYFRITVESNIVYNFSQNLSLALIFVNFHKILFTTVQGKQLTWLKLCHESR